MIDYSYIIQIPVVIFAVVVHESAHGWVAEKFGDKTARLAGRITLNPVPHIDPFMTIILPIILIMSNSPVIAGAKPVPVNYYNLRNPKRDSAFVALAGPVSNVLIALCSLILTKLLTGFNFFNLLGLKELLLFSFIINILLAAFNLIPIPPLDGSRIISSILPDELAYKYNSIERYGFFIIIGLFYLGILQRLLFPILYFIEYILNLIVY